MSDVKKALLAVSFGTSAADTREKTIGAVERRLAGAFEDRTVRRAFTSGVIIKKLAEEGTAVASVSEALESLISEGFNDIIVQPTHIINGREYDGLVAELRRFAARADIYCGRPLLTASDDYAEAVEIMAGALDTGDDRAVVLMGHGTEHYADSAYAALDYRFKAMGHENFFVGTVEGYPDVERVIEAVRSAGFKKAVLAPFMLVAGDHAVNDMAAEPYGWAGRFKAAGIDTCCLMKGLGEYEGIREMFVRHAGAAVRL